MNFSPATNLFGLIGHPVSHSKSPWLFNQIFKHEKMDQVYLAFDHHDATPLITSMRHLNIKGYSVTVPHKESVVALIDKFDPLTSALKSANTIVNLDGVLTGYNTDGIGAIEAIENYEAAHQQAVGNWKNHDITFLGSGGAARGIALSMLIKYQFKGNFHLVARNQNKAQQLINDITKYGGKATYFPWKEISQGIDTDLIINTTTIGMAYSTTAEQSPIQLTQFAKTTKSPIVFDIVYTPLNTPLLQLAKDQGLGVIDGLDMFLSQANHQLQLWTGKKLPLSLLRSFFLNFNN